MINKEKPKRIKLKDGEDYNDFLKNNDKKFLELVIKAIEFLSKNEDLDCSTAFIVYGGKLKKPKEFIVQRSSINEIITNALGKMESYEEYEICNKLIKLQEKF
tara:strand:- start:138409 stop:138717 length:309 start_codon:yes stop_codon:yes gene_type:complete